MPPAASEGIDLAGAALEMVFILAIGATVYVNGRRAYYDRWWADTRGVPLLLSEQVRPGLPLTVAVHAEQGDGFGIFIQTMLRYSRLEEFLFDLDLFRQQMAFTHHLASRAGRSRRRATSKAV